jgi:hypothetical protein
MMLRKTRHEVVMNDVLLALFVGALIWLIWYYKNGPIRRLSRDTLTLEQYCRKHPECKTGHGIKCAACGSKSIKNWGVDGADDARRVFICNHCNARLYKSNGW